MCYWSSLHTKIGYIIKNILPNLITVRVLQQWEMSPSETLCMSHNYMAYHTIMYHWPSVCTKTGFNQINFNNMLHIVWKQ